MVVVTAGNIQPLVRVFTAAGAPLPSPPWKRPELACTPHPMPLAASRAVCARGSRGAGVALGSFMWDTSARLLEWGWTSALQLACVETSGMVVLRSVAGDKLKEFSMGPEPTNQGLVAAALAGDCLAVLTRSLGVWAVSDVAQPRPVRLAPPPLGAELAATCRVAVLQPHQSLSGSIEVRLTAFPLPGRLFLLRLQRHAGLLAPG